MNTSMPTMMTIREITKKGLMPENALRRLLKENKLPVIYVGKKALVNYTLLCEQLNQLGQHSNAK